MITMVEELLTLQEVADLLRVKVPTVKRYIKNGELEFVQVGNRQRVSQAGLRRYIQKRTTPETRK